MLEHLDWVERIALALLVIFLIYREDGIEKRYVKVVSLLRQVHNQLEETKAEIRSAKSEIQRLKQQIQGNHDARRW